MVEQDVLCQHYEYEWIDQDVFVGEGCQKKFRIYAFVIVVIF
jgi:hypothetical protein